MDNSTVDANLHEKMRDEAQNELDGLYERIHELEAVVKYHAARANTIAKTRAFSVSKRALLWTELVPRPAEAVRFQKASQIEAVEQVLRESSKPLRAAEIVEKLQAGGFPVDDPARLRNSIFTGMTRKPAVFERVDAGLWRIKASTGSTEEP